MLVIENAINFFVKRQLPPQLPPPEQLEAHLAATVRRFDTVATQMVNDLLSPVPGGWVVPGVNGHDHI